MKKKVDIKKEIVFPSMIGEITAISLEKDLKFVDDFDIEGRFILSGKYKLTEASRLEEDFYYEIPVEIVLTNLIDKDTAKIEITDFTYKIDNDSKLICDIEVTVDGVDVSIEEDRECDGDPVSEKEIEIPKLIEEKEIVEDNIIESLVEENRTDKEDIDNNIEIEEDDNIMVDDNNDNLLFNFNDSSETYGTFIVYIVRQNETINSILDKYKVSKEELEMYNDIKNIDIGTRLIIPILNDKNK